MSEVVTFRIPKELREKMREFEHVNWSEVVREAIKARIEAEERRRLMIEAAKDMDRVRNRFLKLYGASDYDSSGVIRLWRRLRG